MNTIEVVGLGALNIDRIYKVERILDDGETVVLDAGSSPAAQRLIPPTVWQNLE